VKALNWIYHHTVCVSQQFWWDVLVYCDVTNVTEQRQCQNENKFQWRKPRNRGGSRGWRFGRSPPPKAWESIFFHNEFTKFGKHHSRYKDILSFTVLSQQSSLDFVRTLFTRAHPLEPELPSAIKYFNFSSSYHIERFFEAMDLHRALDLNSNLVPIREQYQTNDKLSSNSS